MPQQINIWQCPILAFQYWTLWIGADKLNKRGTIRLAHLHLMVLPRCLFHVAKPQSILG